MRVGVLGGTFDPVHAGHLKLALSAFDQLNLRKVVFVPSSRNPLKKAAPAPAAKRLSALKRALKPYPFLEIDPVELARKGPSFTVDTLEYLKRKHRGAVLYFLTGADSARDLGRWKSFGRVKKLSKFVVASRPGYRAERLPEGTLAMPFDAVDASSTAIRRKNGEK